MTGWAYGKALQNCNCLEVVVERLEGESSGGIGEASSLSLTGGG